MDSPWSLRIKMRIWCRPRTLESDVVLDWIDALGGHKLVNNVFRVLARSWKRHRWRSQTTCRTSCLKQNRLLNSTKLTWRGLPLALPQPGAFPPGGGVVEHLPLLPQVLSAPLKLDLVVHVPQHLHTPTKVVPLALHSFNQDTEVSHASFVSPRGIFP